MEEQLNGGCEEDVEFTLNGESGNEEIVTQQVEEANVAMEEIPPVQDILHELTEFASTLLTSYRQLEEEGITIQAELDELNQIQEQRCQKMIARLQHAGNTIYAFGQGDDEPEQSQF